MEYAATVWDPYTQCNKDKIENVQRRAARFVCNQYRRTASVTSMIEKLEWPSLEERRRRARLAMLFKIRHGIVQIDNRITDWNLSEKPARPRRDQHDKQYCEPTGFKQDYRLGSFFPRTVQDWNSLPQKTVDAESLDTFVSRVCSKN